MRRFLCLRFPAWPLQRLVADKRELRASLHTQAIVIHKRNARGGDVVHLGSARAWQRGIRPGMPLAEALALFAPEEQCFVSAHHPERDGKWLARIAVWCERYSPQVGWETIAGGRKELLSALPPGPEPEALYLDITGIGSLFGGEAALAHDLLARLAERGLSARIGIADTLGAAWAVTTAKSKIAKTTKSTVTIVPRDGQEAALAKLPVACLRLAEETIDLLRQLGVHTIEQLLALPRKGLSARFGLGLTLRIDQALGSATELIHSHRPAPAFHAEWLLEYPTNRRDTIENILEQLVERLSLQLSSRQQGAVQLACRLDVAKREPICWTLGLYRPTASPRHLLDLLRMQFERVTTPGEVGRIGLSALQTAPLETYQSRLFEDPSLKSSRARAALLDRLSSRLGVEAVLQPWLKADALPECAVQLVPAVAQVASARGRTRSPATHLAGRPAFASSHRPLVLLSPPVELETTAILPDGPPIRFRHAGRLQEVARHWGPERMETGWWRGRSRQRDYYRVETKNGTRFWLFRRLQDGRWFLHGVFE